MESVIQYLENMPSSYRSGVLVTGLVLFWILEGAVPLFQLSRGRIQHAALNLGLTILQLIVAFSFGLLVVEAARVTSANQFGLLYLIQLPMWLHVVCGVLLLDFFGGYLIHRIQHRLPALWRFHIVHHADRHVDVTTGLRHHPFETLFRLSSQLTAVLIGGIPIGVVFLYQLLSIFFTQLTHANIRSFRRADRYLSWIFVTPNMHKVHHHQEKPLTDTNYGNVFSIWDRLLGTFAQVDPEQLVYGIDSLPDPGDHDRLGRLLTLPFRRWHSVAGISPSTSQQRETTDIQKQAIDGDRDASQSR